MLTTLKCKQLIYHQSITRMRHRLINQISESYTIITVVKSYWVYKAEVKEKIKKEIKRITFATFQ